MLFLNINGEYIEVLRKNFTNDKSYYKAIMSLKGYKENSTKPYKLIL